MATINTWQKLITEQRAEFLRHARLKLSEIDQLLTLLQGSLWETVQAQQVARLFHQLAGSGGFFDLHDFCTIAGRAEGLALQMVSKHSDVNAQDVYRLKEFTTALTQMLDSGELTVSEELAVADAQAPQEKTLTDVLLVSGDPRALLRISKSLEELDCSVRSFRTEQAADQSLQEKLPDALILHVPLAEGSGYDLSLRFRQRAGAQRAPVIMLSGEGGFLSKVSAIRAGVDNFFEPPFDIKQVCDRLRYLLDRDKPEMFRILSVEDDLYQAGLIKATLESAGYNVFSVNDPKEFENALLACCPDLILLDIDLGVVNGFELARFVRQDDRFAAVPIIFLTTHNQLEAHIESARSGGDDHLVKPVSPQFMIATIAGRLERYRTLRKLTQMDGLTQCLTFATFMDSASKQVERTRAIYSSTIMIFDVDNINQLNSQLGFAQGDRSIQSLARVVQNTLRHTELICRASGDEIVALIENLDDTEVAQLAAHILYEFAAVELFASGTKFSTTASAGASLVDGMTLDSALQSARMALQLAKQQGKNRFIKA